MARTARDIDAFLAKLERRFEMLAEDTFAIDSGPHGPPIALRIAPPMAVVRVSIGPAPVGHAATHCPATSVSAAANASLNGTATRTVKPRPTNASPSASRAPSAICTHSPQEMHLPDS